MKKLLLVLLILAGLYWYGSHRESEKVPLHTGGTTVAEQEASAEHADDNGKLDGLVGKASLLGKWYAIRMEEAGTVTELPRDESPMLVQFDFGGNGRCTMIEDTCDIAWSAEGDTVEVVLLLGGELDIPLLFQYQDGELLWETEDSVICFSK